MNYEIFEVENWRDNTIQKHVVIYLDEDNARTFPADESNPDYIAFIEANPDALKEVTE